MNTLFRWLLEVQEYSKKIYEKVGLKRVFKIFPLHQQRELFIIQKLRRVLGE